MLRAKKAKEEATAAAAAAAATASADGSTGGDAGAGSPAPKMSLLGGDEKKSTGAPLKKVKPSELRVTKGGLAMALCGRYHV